MTLDKCVYDKNTGNGLEDLIYGVVETVIRTLITRSGKQSQSLVYTDFHSDDNDYNWAYMKYEEFRLLQKTGLVSVLICQPKNKEDVHISLSEFSKLTFCIMR